MKQIIIEHFFNYEFVYIFLLISVIFLFVSIFIKQKTIKKISIIIFSIFIVLSFLELVLSFSLNRIVVGFNMNYLNHIDPTQIIKEREISFYDKTKDRVIKIDKMDCNLDEYGMYELVYDQFCLSYNNCFRWTECNKDSEDVYVFMGCSYIFGTGLQNEETLPYYFSKLYDFNKNIINCGIGGQSTNTSLNILNSDVLSSLTKTNSNNKHFFYILILDQIYRNFRINVPSDLKIYKNGKITDNKQPYGVLKKTLIKSYIFRKIFLPIIDDCNKEYYENYMVESLEEMNKIVQEKYNSKLTILVWPNDYGERFINKLKRTSLDLIFLPEYFNSEEEGYKIKHDGHPTAKANEEIAKMLYEHINKENK